MFLMYNVILCKDLHRKTSTDWYHVFSGSSWSVTMVYTMCPLPFYPFFCSIPPEASVASWQLTTSTQQTTLEAEFQIHKAVLSVCHPGATNNSCISHMVITTISLAANLKVNDKEHDSSNLREREKETFYMFGLRFNLCDTTN